MKKETLGFMVFLLTVLTISVSWAAWQPKKTLYQKDSIYQTLTVFQEGTVLELYGGRACFSAIDTAKPYDLMLEYTGMMIMGTAYVENPQAALMIGLGGGTVANYLRKYYPHLNMTIVELDEVVFACAQKFFNFKADEKMKVVIQDGRRYLMKDQERYDLIFLDAYYGDYIPFHLLTKEFLALVKDHLRPNGIVVSNTWSAQKLYERESATYADVFGHLDSYLGQRSGNRIIIASKDGEPADEASLRQRMVKTQANLRFTEVNLPEVFELTYDRNLKWPKETPILTDDYAPVNTLVEP
jgi:spermidine synthase